MKTEQTQSSTSAPVVGAAPIVSENLRANPAKSAAVREAFKPGDWVFGIGEHVGCSPVFEGYNGSYQPFDYLNDFDPAHFRLATVEEIAEARDASC